MTGLRPPTGYLSREHAPVDRERTDLTLEVRGELPERICGAFVRNSPNPQFPPPGRHHWFDGDGMVHGITLEHGRASYRNRWIRTAGFAHEAEAGEALWGGINDRPRRGLPGGPLKDTANTDLIAHNGQLIATWWLSGQPMALDPRTLQTLGPATFGGKLRHSVCAHPKVDPVTGELVFMGYSMFQPPYMHVGVVGPSGELAHMVELDLPHPHIPHDIALTRDHTLVMDMPLGWAVRDGKRRIHFFRERPLRIGVLPRRGLANEIRWFDADPGYVYHTIGAWQDGDCIELIACRVADPIPERPSTRDDIARLDLIELVPHLYRWRLNIADGSLTEGPLDDTPTEFPTADPRHLGSRPRWSFNPRIAPRSELLFDAFLRYDLAQDSHDTIELPGGWYGGELAFIPDPLDEAEGAGWIGTAITTDTGEASRFKLWDARSLDEVAEIQLPWRIPPGFHCTWAPLAGA